MSDIRKWEVQELDNFEEDIVDWIKKQSEDFDLPLLLAFMDDGVIWGRVKDGQLLTSSDFFEELEVALQTSTLQGLHLFGESGELIVERQPKGFLAKLLQDVEENSSEYLDEIYWLWGNGEKSVEEFTLMEEGRQGFLHAVPLPDVGENQRVGLKIRHYLVEDEIGRTRIAWSRLVELDLVEGA